MTEAQPVAAPPTGARPAENRGNYLSSVVALVFGIGLAVGVSAVFGLLGWGGEFASQTAGASAGAAPLILDGIRQRRARGRRQDLQALSRGHQVRPKLLVASLFGFALLLTDSAIGYAMAKATQLAVRLADGDPAKWVTAYAALGGVVVFPLVIGAAVLLGLAAGHRLGEQRKRWICFGMGVYTVVRILHLSLSGGIPGYSQLYLVLGAIVTVPVLLGAALLGAWWAKKTQAVFNATSFFRRLHDEDQEAALALLGETVDARGARTRAQDPGASSASSAH